MIATTGRYISKWVELTSAASWDPVCCRRLVIQRTNVRPLSRAPGAAMTASRRFRSLMGQGGEALPVIDALGCLRSLRARLALDGVSWAQGGKVENAVGR
jgi:hypothetical protein